MEYGKKIRLGGFHLLKYKKDEMTFIKVSTIMGNWAMEYREDTKMFAHLDNDDNKEWMDKYMGVLVNTSMVIDPIMNRAFQVFMKSTLLLVEELSKKGEVSHGKEIDKLMLEYREMVMYLVGGDRISDEEDAEILKNMKTEAEMYEHLNGEEGKTDSEV